MDAVDEYLYSPYGLHLNAPSFATPNDDIGFVTRVYQGVKENGAIFSHPNPWAWVAEAKLGRGDRAMKFYDSLLPYNQNDMIEKRISEPYSYCQFVMGKDHPDHGKANHPWLTGSSGWAYIAATNYILGVRLSFDGWWLTHVSLRNGLLSKSVVNGVMRYLTSRWTTPPVFVKASSQSP